MTLNGPHFHFMLNICLIIAIRALECIGEVIGNQGQEFQKVHQICCLIPPPLPSPPPFNASKSNLGHKFGFLVFGSVEWNRIIYGGVKRKIEATSSNVLEVKMGESRDVSDRD